LITESKAVSENVFQSILVNKLVFFHFGLLLLVRKMGLRLYCTFQNNPKTEYIYFWSLPWDWQSQVCTHTFSQKGQNSFLQKTRNNTQADVIITAQFIGGQNFITSPSRSAMFFQAACMYLYSFSRTCMNKINCRR